MKRIPKYLQRAMAEGWLWLVRTKSDHEAVRQGCYVDLAAAERIRVFFRKFLRHYKGKRFKGKPFELLAWEWQRVVAPLFGWKLRSGLRRFRRVFLTVAKKNGKTMLSAGIALAFLCVLGEAGARVYLAANDKKQAGLCYSDCSAMVRHSKLIRKLNVLPSQRRIAYPETESTLETLSADTATSDGIDASLVLLDELHLARSREMFDTLEHAGAARDEPLFMITTTAGDSMDSICWEEYSYAKSIDAGETIDIHYLAIIFEAPMGADVDDPATWQAANPSLGEPGAPAGDQGTIPFENFKRDLEAARKTPTKWYNFLRRRLNQWAKAPSKFVSAEAWKACHAPSDEMPDFADRDVFVGLDLGDNSDLTAAVELCPLGDVIYVRAHFWCPIETFETRVSEARNDYRAWEQGGWLKLTSGASTEFPVIKADLLAIAERSRIVALAYDPYQALNLISDLAETRIVCVKVPQQVPHIGPAMKELERRILARTIRHDGNPILAWNLGNVVPRIDGQGNILPDRKKRAGKIDGASALVTGLSRAIFGAPKSSVYEKRGTLWV